MTLQEQLAQYSDNTMICLGAKTSYLYIAPKEEMVSWLATNVLFVKFQNEELEAAKASGHRLDEEPKTAYLDREVIRAEWSDFHQGNIVIVTGTESGQYSMRSEVTGESHRPLEDVDETGAQMLIAQVLAQFVDDIAEEEAFTEFYGDENSGLTDGGLAILKAKRRVAQSARHFFSDSDILAQWTSFDGGYLERLGKQKKLLIIHNWERKMVYSSMSKKFRDLYTGDQRERIADMIVEGVDYETILQKVGRGKNLSATVEDIEACAIRYEAQRIQERRKFFKKSGLDLQIPLKKQMKMDEQAMSDWYQRHKEKIEALQKKGACVSQ